MYGTLLISGQISFPTNTTTCHPTARTTTTTTHLASLRALKNVEYSVLATFAGGEKVCHIQTFAPVYVSSRLVRCRHRERLSFGHNLRVIRRWSSNSGKSLFQLYRVSVRLHVCRVVEGVYLCSLYGLY
jgi:hypothetical protein